MSGSKAGPWITGTVLGAIVILVAAWFLGISPQLTAASEAKEQARAQQDANAVLEAKIATLAEQFTHIEEYRAELAASRVQIPTGLDLAAYQRELNLIASAHSVVITNLTFAGSQAVVPPAAEAAAAAEDGAATDTEQPAEGDAAATPEPAEPAGVAGFYQVPVTMEVLGTYPNVAAFLEGVQSGTQRLMLVSGLTGTGQQQAEAGGGRPATAPGDLSLVVTGSLFVLQDQTAVPPVVDPAAPKPALPVPPADKNPLVPLA